MSIVNEIKLSGKFNLLKEHFPFSWNERRRIVEFLRQRIELFMLKQWKIFYKKITSFSDSEHWIAMMKFKLLVVFAIEWSQWQSSLRLKLWQIRSSSSSVKPERGGNPSDSLPLRRSEATRVRANLWKSRTERQALNPHIYYITFHFLQKRNHDSHRHTQMAAGVVFTDFDLFDWILDPSHSAPAVFFQLYWSISQSNFEYWGG